MLQCQRQRSGSYDDETTMAEPAVKRWTTGEFLAWDNGTGRRYELVDGHVLAMAPPSSR